MMRYTVTFLPMGKQVQIDDGRTILQAQILAGLRPDAPCGGKGTCGKCRVMLEGVEVLACQTPVRKDMTVWIPRWEELQALTEGVGVHAKPDGEDACVLAYDVGTTTLVAYLLDGHSGDLLAQESCLNPQKQFGADVISRLQYAIKAEGETVTLCVREALTELAKKAAAKVGIPLEKITTVVIAGNTAMHHLLLGIDPKPLVTPPYMPAVSRAVEKDGLRVLPNIAGFVGGDTVACMVATRFDQQEELTLLLDIGTNGEMVLGNRDRILACSTAAGPAFEGALISCGMRGVRGAVDHVYLQNGEVAFHTIGEAPAEGICGSGLLDLVAVLLEEGILLRSGRLPQKQYRLCEKVILTQKDVRQLQLAKGAIRAGIELLAEEMGVRVEEIRRVYLAGAFGNYMDPASACRIGMIPPVLRDRIVPIGNGAGAGARLCALSRDLFVYSQELADKTEFIELASLRRFQERYIAALDL